MEFVELMSEVDPPRVGWTMSIREQWYGGTSEDVK
jgi:hypothetical protein